MNQVYKENASLTSDIDVHFAHKGILDIENKLIKGLLDREMITPKLYLLLEKEITEETS